MKTILVLTLSGSVLTLLLTVLRYTFLRKMPSTVYYYAWLLVLLRFAVPLPGLVPATAEKAEPLPKAPVVYVEMDSEDNAKAVSGSDHADSTMTASDETDGSHIALDATETKAATVSDNTPATKAPSFSIDWKSPKLWFSVWALGAVVSMGITVLSYIKFSFGLKRDLMEPDSFTKAVYASIPGRKPALYFSDSARTPMMLGVLKPKIVLPMREYNEEILLNILRHELTHYRRFDLLYKWATTAVLAAHWFNPLAWFIRRELNRACEMSCDEMLLRSMNKDEKQSYGNTLLLMAASTALPPAVIATSFATEKRNLKERLVQIMNYKKSGTRLLAAVLSVALLTGCGMAAGPLSGRAKEAQADAPKVESKVVKVKTVDEFLKAIAPNTEIELAEGEYDLSKASDYAKQSGSDYYSWNNNISDGANTAELIIKNVEGLTIRGAGAGKTTIAAVPRYANVIRFTGCNNLSVSDLTAGHTREPGECTGGVFLLENCTDINVDKCGLYGCGTIGVAAENSKNLNVTGCDIYECSYGAVEVRDCNDVLVRGCDIHDHGTREVGESAYILFSVNNGTGFTVYNCKIHDNKAEELLYASLAKNVYFLSNEVTKNTFKDCTFCFEQNGATVDGCHFEGNYSKDWYKVNTNVRAADLNGNKLEDAQFKDMELRDIKPETVVPKTETETAGTAKQVDPGAEVSVKTVDEFLSAIGPDRTIVLDGTNFDLTKAKDYGGKGTEYYRWGNVEDGAQLIISNVKNLTIKAKDPDPAKTSFETLPRYADVICFDRCENINVTGFTAGHTKEKGSCSGDVLSMTNCKNIKVEKMRLYGCGDIGIDAQFCSDIDVVDTEIYECSSSAGLFRDTVRISFKDCNIHDIPYTDLEFIDCENVTWNGERHIGSHMLFEVKADGTLVPDKGSEEVAKVAPPATEAPDAPAA